MAEVVGSIGPKAEATITEEPAWTEPKRVMIFTDQTGRRHGRIEWLSAEVDAEFLAQAHALFLVATGAVVSTAIPSVAS